MKNLAIALLMFGMAFASGSLKEFDVDVSVVCDGTKTNNIVLVTDDDDPVENVFVKIEDIDPWKQVTTGLTNSSGEFMFTACGDTYNVTASYGGYATEKVTVALQACGQCKDTPPPPPDPEPEEDEGSNETNTTSPPATPPPSTQPSTPPASPPTTTSTPTTQPPAANEEPATEPAGEPEEENKKKPLPCCASSAAIIALLAIRTRI